MDRELPVREPVVLEADQHACLRWYSYCTCPYPFGCPTKTMFEWFMNVVIRKTTCEKDGCERCLGDRGAERVCCCGFLIGCMCCPCNCIPQFVCENAGLYLRDKKYSDELYWECSREHWEQALELAKQGVGKANEAHPLLRCIECPDEYLELLRILVDEYPPYPLDGSERVMTATRNRFTMGEMSEAKRAILSRVRFCRDVGLHA